MSTQAKTWLDDPKLLVGLDKRLDAEHASRQAEAKTYLRSYWDRVVYSVDYTRPYRELAVFQALKESYGGNLTREVVDAAVSILCRQMSPEVLPKGDDFELEQGCKQASRLIEGVYDNCDFLRIAKQAIRDGATADIGPAKGLIDAETNEIKFERVDPLSLKWVENGTGQPRTLLQTYPVAKDELAARYPRFRSQIMDMRPWSMPIVVGVDAPGTRRSNEVDTVKVIEGWCVALGEKNPGRHSIVCGECVFENEAWAHDISPIITFKWSDDYRGYAGCPLSRIVSRYDNANRRLLRMVYAGLQGAVPQLLEHEDCETEGPSDVEFGRWKWTGATPPSITMPQTVSPEVIAQIEKNYVRAYAEGGVNQSMATGAAPARYTSGAAQREFVDIANTRLLDAQQQVEKFWRDGAKVVVMLAQQAKKAHVRVKGANYYESVTFPRLSRDKYRVQFGLSSGLSLTPAGRKQDLADLQELGVIDTAEVARSLNLPDIQQIADRLNAPRDLVMRQISMALEQGIFSMPSALQDLNALVKIGGEEYQRAKMRGNYPPKHLEVLRRLIKAAQARLAPAAPGLPAALPAAPGAPAPGPGPQLVPSQPAATPAAAAA